MDPRIEKAIKECEAEAKKMMTFYEMYRIGWRVCERGCGTLYNPTYGHKCE